MSETQLDVYDKTGIISNVRVYDFDESLHASGYPMQADIDPIGNIYKSRERAKKLGSCQMGTGHDSFLKGIVVNLDLTLPVKVWTELERYTHCNIVSSQSTMHRLSRMDMDNSFVKWVDDEIKERMKVLQIIYDEEPTKENFYHLVYSCPTGLKLTARVTTNYLQLKTIYKQRRNHRLQEWQVICDWIETLPLMRDVLGIWTV